jgi:RNA polymerase-binding protein DksA
MGPLETIMTAVLSPTQIEFLEAELKQRQQQLDGQLADHQQGRSRVEHAREVLQQDGDDATQRDADREVDLARSDRGLAELGRVSQALQRIHHADYGLCRDCGEHIPFERLMLEPWAQRCVACAAQAEGQYQPRLKL